MNNKKYKSTIAIIVTLATLSGGMFAYQNIYLPKAQSNQKETVYVAKDDIKAYSELKADMFDAVQVSKGSVLNGYIKDISKATGYKLKGNLLKGEALNTVRLTKEDLSEQGGLIVSMTPDSTSNVKEGDYVNVYVLLTDKSTKANSVKLLFGNKKVMSQDSSIKAELSNAAKISSADSVVISFTESELKDYYVAKESGKIIVAKVGDIDTKTSSDNTEVDVDTTSNQDVEKFDADSTEVKNSTNIETKDGKSLSVVSYEVKDGDTVQTISIKFKTTEDIITELNDGKTEFKDGDRITVPAI